METGTTEKVRENLPPRLENCQAMYDKEQQRLTKRKSVRPNAEAVEYYDFQREFASVNQV